MWTGELLTCSSPYCWLRLKGAFFPICSAFKRRAGGSQPASAHTTSKWRQWKQSTQISKQVLAPYVRFFFFFSFLFFFKRTTAKMIALNSNYTICSSLCPESATDNVENIARSPFSHQVKQDKVMWNTEYLRFLNTLWAICLTQPPINFNIKDW